MLDKRSIKHIFNIPTSRRMADEEYATMRCFVNGLMMASGFESKHWQDWLDFCDAVHVVHGGSLDIGALYRRWLASGRTELAIMANVPGKIIFDKHSTDNHSTVQTIEPDLPYIHQAAGQMLA